MKLLVDIGNSRIKWASIDDNGLNEGQSFQRGKTSIKAALNKAWKTLSDIDAVYVANVGGEKLATQLTEWTEKQWQITPVYIHTEKKRFGVTNAYDEPSKLGIDRWLSLIAARQHARQAQCVIDCGTAMTIDIVTKTGQHQGGMILPGLSLMRSALATSTHALTEETDEKEFKTLATNTYSAIQAGTLYSVTATLERIINDLQESFDNKIRFIITGGDAESLLPLLPDNINHYPDIVLKGLAFYARQDDKKKRAEKRTDNNKKAADESTENATEGSGFTQETSVERYIQKKNKTQSNSKPRTRRVRRSKAPKAEQESSTQTEKPDTSLPEEAI
ncbi:type III pantothenate kinase [Methylophaga thiooxydans]|uniref:Type III pantothenate kinase n=1 Tax=Methylophaga thiooxydans DMS010 TaxID=637616 RepID=C0N3Y8_9GAMM|nr:type III pantothenate kinase [Methylophaga thiooxydans]EEF80453.1 transcriptional activator, putative, Baf family [Methylophaga thiooxydans DMS010]